MHEQQTLVHHSHRQLAQKFPTTVAQRFFGFIFEDLASPIASSLGPDVKVIRLIKYGMIMIAAEAEYTPLHHDVDAFFGVGAIPDDIALANNSFDSAGVDVGHHSLERFQIA